MFQKFSVQNTGSFDSLVELGRADDSNGLWQHHLIGAVCVEVDAGQKGCLCGVSLETHTSVYFHMHTVCFNLKTILPFSQW